MLIYVFYSTLLWLINMNFDMNKSFYRLKSGVDIDKYDFYLSNKFLILNKEIE